MTTTNVRRRKKKKTKCIRTQQVKRPETGLIIGTQRVRKKGKAMKESSATSKTDDVKTMTNIGIALLNIEVARVMKRKEKRSIGI